jgi:hypothetical protein
MPYDKPNPDNACENCAGGPVYGGSTHCAGCECPDPEFVRSGVQEQDLGYHWSPVYWTCYLCVERYAVGLYGQSIAIPYGPTICAYQECLGAILRGLEAMRKGGMAVHGGRRDACVMQRGEQDAGEFYQQLKLAGRDDG